MPFLLVIMERQVAAMYEEFFELMYTPFTRDIRQTGCTVRGR